MKTSIKLIRKMAWNSIKGNKRRSVLTIFAISLAVCLFWCVLTFYHSYSTIQKKEVIKTTGAYHAEIDGISEWQKGRLEKDKRIKKLYVSKKSKDVFISDKILTRINVSPQIITMDRENSILPIYSGRQPEEINEIMMDKWVMETLGIELELNQTIDLAFSMKNDESGDITEIKETCKIVGILDDVKSFRMSNVSYLVVSEAFLEKYSKETQLDVKVLLESNFNCANTLEGIISSGIGINPDSVKKNEVYLDAYDISYDKILLLFVICFFIIMVAVIVVFNIFNVYFVQKINVFGSLKAIGFTDRQIVKFMFIENLILSAAGSTLGIILGMITKYALSLFAKNNNFIINNITINSAILINISSIVVGVMIVVVALIKPINKIMKLSVIKIIKYNPVIDKMNYKRENKIRNKLSIKHLAPMYLFRYKKRTITYIFSISAMGIIFIVCSSVLKSADFENLTSMSVQGDFNIQLADDVARRDDEINPISSTMIEEIEKCKEIEKVDTIMYHRGLWEEQDADRLITLLDEHKDLGIKNSDITSIFYGYNDDFISSIIAENKNLTISLDDMKTKNCVIIVQDEITSAVVGDKIHFIIDDNEEERTEEVIIAGIVQNNISNRGYKSTGCDIIMHQNLFESLGLDTRIQRVSVVSKKEKQEQVKLYLDSVIASDENLSIVSYEELLKDYMETKNVAKFISYSFIMILFLIVVFNLINTTFTNVTSRKKEFGILEALGLTLKQLNRLLQMEGIILSSISVIIILLVGIPLGYMAVCFLKIESTYMIYYLPIIEIISMACVIFAIQYIIILFSIKILNSQSVVEKIKYRE